MKVSKKYLIFDIIIGVLALAINAYIIMHSCFDASKSTNAAQPLVDVVEQTVEAVTGDPNTINSSNYNDFVTFVRKAFGHFGLFFISGLLTSLAVYLIFNPFKWSKYWMLITFALVFGFGVAAITETIQLNVPGRSGEFTDVLIDFSGYVTGFLIILLVLFLVIRKQNKKRQLVTE